MKRRPRFPIGTRTIKSAIDPLRHYIVATIGCFLIAWFLLSLSHEAAPGSSAAVWIRTVGHALLWVATAAAISHVVLFAFWLFRDAQATTDSKDRKTDPRTPPPSAVTPNDHEH